MIGIGVGVADRPFLASAVEAVQNLTAVATDGWQATWPTPPATLTSNDVPVTRSGYDSAGASRTFTETLDVTARVRQPGVATETADTVALSDYIYSGETIAGVTNSSTRAYPYAQFAWMVRDRQEVKGNSVTLRIAVAHRHARNGRPVAGVRFIVKDHLDAEASVIVTACTGQLYSASGLTASVYEGTVDITALSAVGAPSGANATDAKMFVIDAEFLPWVGAAHKVSVITASNTSDLNSVLLFANNRDDWRKTIYAYVDATSGDDATGVVSETAATAQANPYATVAAANGGQSDWHTANTLRNVMDGSIIRLEEGTHVHTAWPRRFCDHYGVIVEGAPGTDPAAVIYTDSGSSATQGAAEILHLKNLTLRKSSSASVVMLDSGNTNATTNPVAVSNSYVSMENVDIDSNSFAPAGNFVWRYGASYYENCTQDAAIVQGNKVIGCSGDFLGSGAVAVVGSKVPNGQIFPNTAARADGLFVGWSHVIADRADFNQVAFVDEATTALGMAFIGNVLESHGTGGSGAAVLINGDGNTDSSDNINFIGNTVVGGRMNISYTDAGGSTRYDHLAVLRFNVIYELNTKAGDFFGYLSESTNAARVGNWNIRYGVSRLANTIIQGESQLGGEASPWYPMSWLGDVQPAGSTAGYQDDALSVSFTDDQSGASGAGDGDYTPSAATDIATVPASLSAFPVDLEGRTIATNGTALAGAVQIAA